VKLGTSSWIQTCQWRWQLCAVLLHRDSHNHNQEILGDQKMISKFSSTKEKNEWFSLCANVPLGGSSITTEWLSSASSSVWHIKKLKASFHERNGRLICSLGVAELKSRVCSLCIYIIWSAPLQIITCSNQNDKGGNALCTMFDSVYLCVCVCVFDCLNSRPTVLVGWFVWTFEWFFKRVCIYTDTVGI